MKILIADDHPLVRAGVRWIVGQIEVHAQCQEAADAAAVLSLLGENPAYDLVLLDLVMPGSDNFGLLDRVCSALPDTPVVVLSASDNSSDMRRALEHGAAGFIPKATPHAVMLNAIRLVLSGGVYVPPAMPATESTSVVNDSTSSVLPAAFDQLTGRQREVLELLGEGLPNKKIAQRLGLSEHTVKIHVTAILDALGAANRTHAVVMAQKQGFATRAFA